MATIRQTLALFDSIGAGAPGLTRTLEELGRVLPAAAVAAQGVAQGAAALLASPGLSQALEQADTLNRALGAGALALGTQLQASGALSAAVVAAQGVAGVAATVGQALATPGLAQLLEQADALNRALGAEALAFRAQAQQVLEQLPPAVWETARQLAAQPWDWQPLAERFTARAAGEGLAQSIVTLGEALDWEEPDYQPPATREDQQAARQLVEEALAQPENWEQALVEKVNACKKRHPVWARLAKGLVTLLLGICSGVAINLLTEAISQAFFSPAPTGQPPILWLQPGQPPRPGEAPGEWITFIDPATGRHYAIWAGGQPGAGEPPAP